MISELVVTAADGSEKPNVDVRGSWAYTPAGGTAQRLGTYHHPDGDPVTLTASVGTVVDTGGGNWSWSLDSTGMPSGIQYVYITATDSSGRQDQAVFRLKIGAPDDGADNGDPHVHTVDGKHYDFQGVGEFTLLRDREGMEIQARHWPVQTATPITDSYTGLTTCVSVNTAVAARVGANRIAYQPGPDGRELQFYIDGKRAPLPLEGMDLGEHWVSAYAVAGGATGLRVDYANQAVLTITPYFWNSYNIWLLNLSVSHTQADEGIMGCIPPDTWLPTLPNGATVGPMPSSLHDRYVTLYKTFANAWRVTDETSLFVYEPGTSTKMFTDEDWPAEKPPCTLKPQFRVPGANPSASNIPLDTAKKICQDVTIDELNRDCVFDVATTGDEDFAKAYLVEQDLKLHDSSVQILANKARSRPGEPLVITATVLPLRYDGPKPTGTVTFLLDDVAAGPPVDLDKQGRASLKTESLGLGVHRIRAVYSASGENSFYHSSSSPSLRHRVEREAPTDRGKAPYQLHGFFYEACDCYTICPCWLGNNPDGGECIGIFAWDIEAGSIDGVDVAGLRAVSVSYHSGLRDGARQRVMIFVDDRATRQQADALAAAFSGRLGGPLQELADILGELLGVERAPIVFRREGRLTTLTVDRHIRVEGRTNEGPSGRLMALYDGKLSNVLGSPAEVGESGRFRIGLSAHGMDLDLRGRSTMSGRFSYVHAPKPDSRESHSHVG